MVNSGLVKGILDLANAFLQLLNTPFGTFVTQVTLLTGLLWGGSGLIKAMSVIPAFFAKAAVGAKGLAAALSLTGPQFALIAAAIAGLIAVMPKVVDWFKTWTDDVYAAQSDLDDYNEKLNINKERLEELGKIPIQNRTSEMKEEIEALKAQNIELEKQISLRQKDLETAKLQKSLDGKHELKGLYVSRSAEYGSDIIASEKSEYLYVDSAKEALDKLKELGYLTQEQVSSILQETNNNAEEALKQLNFTLTEGVREVGSQTFYEKTFDQFEQVQKKLQSGEINADTIHSYIELKDSLNDLFDSASSVEDSGLPEWVLQLRDNFSELPDITDQVVDSYYNFADTIRDLNDGMEINDFQYQQLIDKFPQLENALTQTENGWVANVDAMNQTLNQMIPVEEAGDYLHNVLLNLVSGEKLNEQQMYELISTYPALITMIHQGADAYYVEIQALVDAANAGSEWARAMIGNDAAATRETIANAKARVEARAKEFHSLINDPMASSYLKQEAHIAYEQAMNDLAALQGLHPSQDTSGISGMHGGSGGGGSHETEKDPIAEQSKAFKEQIKLMEHKLFLMEKEGASEEKRIEQVRKIQDEIERQKQWYYSQGLDENSKYIQELEKQWWEYEDQIKDLYKDQAEIYEMLFGAVANRAQDEIDILEKKKQEIQDQNEEIERQIKLEEALDALARAKQQKVLVYKDGKMQYVQDVDAVAKAQEAVDEAQREQEVDKQLEDIDKQIDKWQEMKDQWSSVTHDYKKQQDLLLIEQKLGIKLEGENWEQRLGNLQKYINKYNELMGKANTVGPVPRGRNLVLTRGVKPMMAGAPSPTTMRSMGIPGPTSMMSTYNMDTLSTSQSPSIVIENFNPSLPNVTDGEGFAAYLKNNFWGQTLQLVKA